MVCAGISFGIFWNHAWDIDLNDASFFSVDILGTIELGKSKVPNPDGILAPILMFPFVLEAIKLWAVVQLKSYSYLALLLSLEAALVGFLITRVSILLAFFFDCITWNTLDE